MAFDNSFRPSYPPLPSPRTPRRRRWLEILLVLGFVLSLVTGLLALAALWSFYAAQSTPLRLDEPLLSVQPDQVNAQLALAELAGDPAEALIYQALRAGQLETSRTILLFQTTVNETEQLGLLIQLAQHFVEADAADLATLLYHQARALVVLDDAFAALERSQALIQISQGLHKVNADAAALDTAIQAFRVARQAPELLPAQRSQLFTSLRPLADQLADQLGGAAFRQELLEYVRNPFLSFDQEPLSPPGLWQQMAPVALPPELMTAIATRQQRARELSNRFAFSNGADIGPELAALQAALQAEDQARGAFVGGLQQAGLSPQQQLWLLRFQRDWLLVKLRLAGRGFGASIMPEWEANQAALLDELNAATAAIGNTFETLAALPPDPLAQADLRLAAAKWLALQIELGQYPHASSEQIDQSLRAAQAALLQLGAASPLPVAYEANATPPGFRIQPTPSKMTR